MSLRDLTTTELEAMRRDLGPRPGEQFDLDRSSRLEAIQKILDERGVRTPEHVSVTVERVMVELVDETEAAEGRQGGV